MDGGRFGGIVDSPSRIPKSVYLSPKISSSPLHSTEVNYFCKSPIGARGRPLPLSPSFSAPLAAMAISNNRGARHDPNELRHSNRPSLLGRSLQPPRCARFLPAARQSRSINVYAQRDIIWVQIRWTVSQFTFSYKINWERDKIYPELS